MKSRSECQKIIKEFLNKEKGHICFTTPFSCLDREGVNTYIYNVFSLNLKGQILYTRNEVGKNPNKLDGKWNSDNGWRDPLLNKLVEMLEQGHYF